MKAVRQKLILAGILAVVIAYVVVYLLLRVTHRITHFSNSHHWDAEKREPGHYVDIACQRDAVSCAVFKPLMLLERAYHSGANN